MSLPNPKPQETAQLEYDLDPDWEFYSFNEPEPGSPPGTLIIDANATIPNIFLIDYTPQEVVGKQLATPEECAPYLHSDSVSWIDVQGLGSAEVLQRLGTVFQLHPLTLEDVVNIPQRAKVDAYPDQLLVILHMVTNRENGKPFFSEQVSLILGKHYVLTVQEEPETDVFEPVRQRIHKNKGTIRQQSADYLAYALIDAVVDGFFPVLENYGERLEELQDEVMRNPTPKTLDRIHKIKRELLLLRRTIWPQRDAIATLIRESSPLISDKVRLCLRDCYDHAVQAMDMIETYRELSSSLMEVYLSSLNNNINEAMRFLTVISTIFIPLTFIVGVYGMNFDTEVVGNIPELKMPYGYWFCWGAMLVIAGGLLTFFWRKGWFAGLSKL